MKVSVCRKCGHFRERRWSQYYEPKYYHPIGFSHKYGFCNYMKKRCTDVKLRDCIPNQVSLLDIESQSAKGE